MHSEIGDNERLAINYEKHQQQYTPRRQQIKILPHYSNKLQGEKTHKKYTPPKHRIVMFKQQTQSTYKFSSRVCSLKY